jgi:hypothetical protein
MTDEFEEMFINQSLVPVIAPANVLHILSISLQF